jgi:hypothetical protein
MLKRNVNGRGRLIVAITQSLLATLIYFLKRGWLVFIYVNVTTLSLTLIQRYTAYTEQLVSNESGSTVELGYNVIKGT